MDWAQILVIILSLCLVAFLGLGIFLIVMLIRVTQQIKTITKSAERTAGHIEQAITSFGSAKAAAYAGRKIFDLFKKKKGKE